HAVPELGAEKVRRVQIDPSPENPRELVLHGEERQPRNVARLEIDEHVDVTLTSKVGASDRSEERELTDIVRAAKGGDSRPINRDRDWHVRTSDRTREWMTVRVYPIRESTRSPRPVALAGLLPDVAIG